MNSRGTTKSFDPLLSGVVRRHIQGRITKGCCGQQPISKCWNHADLESLLEAASGACGDGFKAAQQRADDFKTEKT